MAPRSVRVGELEVAPLLDAIGVLGELAELYPEVQASEWEPYRALYPELFAGTRWVLRCACYLVRGGDRTMLVDTGVGPPGLWEWGAEREGALPGLLDELGIARDDVDVVFLTHLHIDHVGWNTDEGGNVLFPRARYLVHEDALAFALTQAERPHVQRCIAPLADRFEKVEDGAEMVPGVTAFAAPGHFPGHLGLRLRSAGKEAVLLADTAVHPVLLDRPEWVYASDGDSAVCAETRRALLPELVDRDVLVACGHYPGTGIGRVLTRNGRVVWEEER
jgi:glyoxylase-like metal-dependent hydrolase (beta-lactamase superfamily II)